MEDSASTARPKPRRKLLVIANPDQSDDEEEVSKPPVVAPLTKTPAQRPTVFTVQNPTSPVAAQTRSPLTRTYAMPNISTSTSGSSSRSSPAPDTSPSPSTPAPPVHLAGDSDGHERERYGSKTALYYDKTPLPPRPVHVRRPSDGRSLTSPTSGTESRDSPIQYTPRSGDRIIIMATADAETHHLVDITGARDAAFIREKIFAKLQIRDEEQAEFSIYRTELGDFATSDALSDDRLLAICKEQGDARGTLKFLVQPSAAPPVPDLTPWPAMASVPVPPTTVGISLSPVVQEPQQGRDDSHSSTSDQFGRNSQGYEASISDDMDTPSRNPRVNTSNTRRPSPPRPISPTGQLQVVPDRRGSVTPTPQPLSTAGGLASPPGNNISSAYARRLSGAGAERERQLEAAEREQEIAANLWDIKRRLEQDGRDRAEIQRELDSARYRERLERDRMEREGSEPPPRDWVVVNRPSTSQGISGGGFNRPAAMARSTSNQSRPGELWQSTQHPSALVPQVRPFPSAVPNQPVRFATPANSYGRQPGPAVRSPGVVYPRVPPLGPPAGAMEPRVPQLNGPRMGSGQVPAKWIVGWNPGDVRRNPNAQPLPREQPIISQTPTGPQQRLGARSMDNLRANYSKPSQMQQYGRDQRSRPALPVGTGSYRPGYGQQVESPPAPGYRSDGFPSSPPQAINTNNLNGYIAGGPPSPTPLSSVFATMQNPVANGRSQQSPNANDFHPPSLMAARGAVRPNEFYPAGVSPAPVIRDQSNSPYIPYVPRPASTYDGVTSPASQTNYRQQYDRHNRSQTDFEAGTLPSPEQAMSPSRLRQERPFQPPSQLHRQPAFRGQLSPPVSHFREGFANDRRNADETSPPFQGNRPFGQQQYESPQEQRNTDPVSRRSPQESADHWRNDAYGGLDPSTENRSPSENTFTTQSSSNITSDMDSARLNSSISSSSATSLSNSLDHVPGDESEGTDGTLKAKEHGWILGMIDDGPSATEATIVPPPPIAPKPPHPLPPIPTEIQPPSTAASEPDEYDGSTDEDSDEGGTLWQKPLSKRRSTRGPPLTVHIDSGAGLTSTLQPPTPSNDQVRKTPTSAGGAGNKNLSAGTPVQRHSSFTKRNTMTWAFRPAPEEVYDRLEEFFPDHNLDEPVIDATPSGASSPNDYSPASTPFPNQAPLRRTKKSIRYVANEGMKVLKRNNTRQAAAPDNVNASALRRRSTKLWGSRLEEVTTAHGKGSPATIPESPTGALSGQKPIFKWVKGELIGKGTYGRVYLALNATTGEVLAVKQVEMPKTVSDRDDSRQLQVVDALRSESDTLKDLDHPNIVQYLGFEQTADFLSIFLEYVPGGSIGGRLRKEGKFDPEVTKFFTSQILDGLAYLHSRGILHRDLKADNILVDHSGICKISDFGISKRSDNIYNNDAYTSMQGSVFWMAPEVLYNNKLGYSAKIDIWSLGCVVLEMWAGRRPWQQEEVVAVMFKLVHSQVPPVPEDVQLDEIAEDFRLKCFSIDPRERPTASQLQQHPYLVIRPGWKFTEFK